MTHASSLTDPPDVSKDLFSVHFLTSFLLPFPVLSVDASQIILSKTLCAAYGSVYPITYLLTPWCRVHLEKLTGLQLVKKFPAFHGTPRFITALTSVRQLSLSWAWPIQSIYPHPTSWRSILILSTHLGLGLPSGLFPSGFHTRTLYTALSSPIRATCPAQHSMPICWK